MKWTRLHGGMFCCRGDSKELGSLRVNRSRETAKQVRWIHASFILSIFEARGRQ